MAVLQFWGFPACKTGDFHFAILGIFSLQETLLVDIQAKLQAGKGPGYERWAKIFNLKQMAQTINFLTENNITDYETLVEKTKAATDRYHELSQQIKGIEKRMAEITELKKHIINYSKTKTVYTVYRESGYAAKFYSRISTCSLT